MAKVSRECYSFVWYDWLGEGYVYHLLLWVKCLNMVGPSQKDNQDFQDVLDKV